MLTVTNTTLPEEDQCLALIKGTTGGPESLPLPAFDPHQALEQYKISSSEKVASVEVVY